MCCVLSIPGESVFKFRPAHPWFSALSVTCSQQTGLVSGLAGLRAHLAWLLIRWEDFSRARTGRCL